MKILKKRQILLLHSALIAESGGSDGIRDEGLLDSAAIHLSRLFPIRICILPYLKKLSVLVSV